MPPRLPFKVEPRSLGVQATDASAWIEDIKRAARANLNSPESLRIAWQNRFRVPSHPRFEDYTPEEAALEMWEQHFYENPDAVEMQGVYKRRDPRTGYVYYVTGDPLIDAYEAAFARGEIPDMSELSKVRPGRDIFREPVFVHKQAGKGFKAGDVIVPRVGPQGMQTTPSGETMAGGAKVTHTDFTSDAWLKKALESDTALKALAGKG